MRIARTHEEDAAVQDTAASPSRVRADDGASAVEFALVVPLLLLLVFGIIDFGVLFGQNLAINNAARDGARYAVVRQIDGSPARSCYQVLSRTRAASQAIALDPQDVGVTVTLNGTTVCSVAAGTPLPASANTAALQKAPCQGSVSGVSDQLVVRTTHESSLVVPILGPSTIGLTGEGYFRCEYSG
jgi:Flp pilus assembly protein TadG